MASLNIEKMSEHLESFVGLRGARSKNNSACVHKFPLQRLKHVVYKYQKMLEIDLDRLQKHRNNIDRLMKIEDWKVLHQEQVHASCTVQQVKDTLQELQRTRAQVFNSELSQFDRRVQDIKVKCVTAVENFLLIKQGERTQPDVSSPLSEIQTHHVVPGNSRAAASWEQLKQEVEELHSMIQCFASVLEQDMLVSGGFEDSSEQTQEEEETKTNFVLKSSNYKMAVFPVVGALIGGAMAGPVGLYAGIKVGSLAGAVGGGVAGLAGGTILNSKSKKPSSVNQNDEDGASCHSESQETSTIPRCVESNPTQQCADDCEKSLMGQIFSWN